MKNILKSKIIPVVIIVVTVILAAIAIFTSVRLYQLRNVSVSPAMPESAPEAALWPTNKTREIVCNKGTSNEWKVINTVVSESINCPKDTSSTRAVSTYSTNHTITVVPNANIVEYRIKYVLNSNWCEEPSGQNYNGHGGVCGERPIRPEKEFTFSQANGYSVSETIARTSETGEACGTFQTDLWFAQIDNCPEYDPNADKVDELTGGLCWTNVSCSGATPTSNPTTTPTGVPTYTNTCNLTFSLTSVTPTPTAVSSLTPTPTATPTATATATPNSCNGTCGGSNTNCGSDLFCYQGHCRNASCPTESDCSCGTSTPGATGTPRQIVTNPQEPSLPNAGISAPTIISIGVGSILLVLSLILAL